MLTYCDFVEELRPLIEQGPSLVSSKGLHEAPLFRKWRHEVTDLIHRIEDSDYTVNCSIQTRDFDEPGSYSYDPNPRERLAAFNRDLEDTMNELSTIIARFDKFSDPKAPQTQPSIAKPLKMPDKVTAAWIWNNAPMSLWLTVAGIAVLIFTLGVTLGQSSLYPELVAKLKPVATKQAQP